VPVAAHTAAFGASRLAYDPAACTQCHLGSMPVPVGTSSAGAAASAAVARVVPEFAHGDHVGRDLGDGTAASCTTCHGLETAAGEFPAMLTLPTALDCSMCHAHSGDRADLALVQARTGRGVTAAEIGACSTCHSAGIPKPEQVFDIPVARVADLVGNVGQFHPPGADCATCHLPGAITVTATGSANARSVSRVFARRSFYAGDSSGRKKSAIHRGDTRKIEDDVVCFSCHWTRTVADSASFGSGMTDPELGPNRRRIGDTMKDFPGGPAPDRGD